MFARQHQLQFFAVEPARLLDLALVDHDLLRQRHGMAADHQRRREWPRLRGKIFDPRAGETDLLEYLAAHRLLDRLTGFGEAGEARPHRRREARRTAEHATLAGDRQHAHDRIGAGKMFGLARRTIAPPAALDELSRRAAIGTVAMARVPTENSLGFGERRQMFGSDDTLDGDRAKINEFEIVARL